MTDTKWKMNTMMIHGERTSERQVGAIATPLVPAVAYSFPNTEEAVSTVCGEKEGVYYGRYGNPTTRAVEERIAMLEEAEDALGVASGMAAISGALLAFLKHGDHVITTKDVYGGTHKFLTGLATRFGIACDFVDCTNLEKVERAIRPNTRVLYLETPSNPCLTVLDIEALSQVAHRHGLKVIVDNTFMTPYLQKPLLLGADVVVHSATKYLNGHGDVLAGFIVGLRTDMTFIRKNIMGDLGQQLNAWDAFLIIRGLKTLGLRMSQHCQSALKIALFLERQEAVAKVYYPGLETHPQYALAGRQMRDSGGVVSFVVDGGYAAASRVINAMELAMISFSLGDPETLVQHPASMTHYSIPECERENFGICEGLIRLSTGLEDADDIINDLQQALAALDRVKG